MEQPKQTPTPLPTKKEKKLQRRNFILLLHHLYTSASRRQPLFKNKSSVRGQTRIAHNKRKSRLIQMGFYAENVHADIESEGDR